MNNLDQQSDLHPPVPREEQDFFQDARRLNQIRNGPMQHTDWQRATSMLANTDHHPSPYDHGDMAYSESSTPSHGLGLNHQDDSLSTHTAGPADTGPLYDVSGAMQTPPRLMHCGSPALSSASDMYSDASGYLDDQFFASPSPTNSLPALGRPLRRARNKTTLRPASMYGSPGPTSSPVKAYPRKTRRQRMHSSPPIVAPLSVLTAGSAIPIKDIAGLVSRGTELRQQEARDRGRIGRPLNVFMLYRSAFANRAKEWCSKTNHRFVSVVAGQSWDLEPQHIRQQYLVWAEQERTAHRLAFPDYTYKPSKKPEGRGQKWDKNDWQNEELDTDVGFNMTYHHHRMTSTPEPPTSAYRHSPLGSSSNSLSCSPAMTAPLEPYDSNPNPYLQSNEHDIGWPCSRGSMQTQGQDTFQTNMRAFESDRSMAGPSGSCDDWYSPSQSITREPSPEVEPEAEVSSPFAIDPALMEASSYGFGVPEEVFRIEEPRSRFWSNAEELSKADDAEEEYSGVAGVCEYPMMDGCAM